MQPPRSSNFFDSLPPTGPITKWGSIAIILVSLVGSLTQRHLGFGLSDLIFSSAHVLDLELWRLFTYPLVHSQPFGLAIGVFVFWLFGKMFEARWGSENFLKYIVLSAVGAAVLAIPLSFLFNAIMPFRDLGYAEGTGPIIDAILVHLAVTAPNSNILFGFVLPMRSRTIIYVILGFELVVGIMTGATGLSTTVGGIVMGYLLTTGNWRPETIWAKWQAKKNPRHGFYVVKPPDDTLH